MLWFVALDQSVGQEVGWMKGQEVSMFNGSLPDAVGVWIKEFVGQIEEEPVLSQ